MLESRVWNDVYSIYKNLISEYVENFWLLPLYTKITFSHLFIEFLLYIFYRRIVCLSICLVAGASFQFYDQVMPLLKLYFR